MKQFIALFIVMNIGHSADAQETKRVTITETYVSSLPGQTMDKLEAVKALIKNPEAVIYKCQLVELTDKVTLKKRKSE